MVSDFIAHCALRVANCPAEAVLGNVICKTIGNVKLVMCNAYYPNLTPLALKRRANLNRRSATGIAFTTE